MKKIILITYLIFLSSYCYGQTGNSDSLKNDTDTLKNDKKETLLRYFINPYLNELKNSNNLSMIKFFDSYKFYRKYGYLESDVSKSFNLNKFRHDMVSSFKILTEAERKRNLGALGKILGYTNAAAAFGLAIYHISKYGLK
jgi:hypothetical protein